MRIVIVYESLFGSTHDIAQAIADGVAEALPDTDLTCVRATDALPEELTADHARGRIDLLVVGGPTHSLGISSARSRRRWLRPQDYVDGHGRDGHALEPDADRPGLRDWLDHLSPAVPGSRAAVFDTRLDRPLHGGAAARIARRLHQHGYDLVSPPEGFVVEGTEGPLRSGELDRARAWGRALVPVGVG
ncbi:MAG TPA: flavodoxin family protein [Kineosporiaceae bacterium]|nr:flavodoxin family protein [Kineosporiaceae bacterium]